MCFRRRRTRMGSAGNSSMVPREVLGFWSIQGMLLVAENGWANKQLAGARSHLNQTLIWLQSLGWPWMTLGWPGVQGQSTQGRLTGVPDIQPELDWTELQTHFRETCCKKPVRPATLVKGSGNWYAVSRDWGCVELRKRKILFICEMRWGFMIIIAGISEILYK